MINIYIYIYISFEASSHCSESASCFAGLMSVWGVEAGTIEVERLDFFNFLLCGGSRVYSRKGFHYISFQFQQEVKDIITSFFITCRVHLPFTSVIRIFLFSFFKVKFGYMCLTSHFPTILHVLKEIALGIVAVPSIEHSVVVCWDC
jgi:hypothetical protein